jgi:hypothetical protein
VHNHHHQSGSTGKTQQGKYGARHTIYDEREQARVTGGWQRECDDAFPVALHALAGDTPGPDVLFLIPLPWWGPMLAPTPIARVMAV